MSHTPAPIFFFFFFEFAEEEKVTGILFSIVSSKTTLGAVFKKDPRLILISVFIYNLYELKINK